jgi:hypothetical protein
LKSCPGNTQRTRLSVINRQRTGEDYHWQKSEQRSQVQMEGRQRNVCLSYVTAF